MWLLLMAKYMGIQEIKSGKGDAEVSDLVIRVRMLCESDLTLYLSMVLVVSRNGESSLMLSIIIRTYGNYSRWVLCYYI